MDITDIMEKAMENLKLEFDVRVYENDVLYIEMKATLLQVINNLLANSNDIKRIHIYQKEV